MSNPIIDATREKRAKAQKQLDQLLESPKAENRSLSDDEHGQFEKLTAKIEKYDRQVRDLEKQEKREAKAAQAAAEYTAPATVKRENMTYDKDGRNSYLRDLAALSVREAGLDTFGVQERMAQHARELDVEAQSDKRVAAMLTEYRRTPADLEARVNPNGTAGTGGEFIPPLWLVSQYIPYLRATRVCANRVRNLPLPPGINVINIPKITTGSLTGIQAAQGGAVTSQDIVTSSVSASVNTIAGQEDISVQLLEQSPIAMDGVVFDDLTRDYDLQLDKQILAGSGSNGQHKGVLNTSSVNAITVSSATFADASTAGTQFRSIVKGVNSVETNRYAPPTAIWAHPRRVNSWSYATDTTARPLFIPSKYGPFNADGLAESSPIPQGVAGELFGLPVVKDANMPTTMSGTATTGGTADPVVVLKEDDVYLWEGTLRMRALPEILSGTLQIRYQVYAYSAFMANRLPVGISILTGDTGLAAPGF